MQIYLPAFLREVKFYPMIMTKRQKGKKTKRKKAKIQKDKKTNRQKGKKTKMQKDEFILKWIIKGQNKINNPHMAGGPKGPYALRMS